jgi:hypothetical protein
LTQQHPGIKGTRARGSAGQRVRGGPSLAAARSGGALAARGSAREQDVETRKNTSEDQGIMANRNYGTRNAQQSDAPAYKVVYGIVKREGMDKGYWTRIGAAFENRDGSLNVKLDFLPTSTETTLQIREPRMNEEDA